MFRCCLGQQIHDNLSIAYSHEVQHFKKKNKLLILSCWHLKLLFRTMMIWFEFLCEAKLPFFVTAEDCGWLYRRDCWPPVVIFALSQKILSGETSAVIAPQLVLIVLAWNESSTNVRISNHFSMIHPVCNGLSKHEMCKTPVQWENFKLTDEHNASSAF